MRVLMLGWEFPPYISGGLGTACHGLSHAMSRQGIDVTFVLPQAIDPVDGTDIKRRASISQPGARQTQHTAAVVSPSARSAPGSLTFRRVPGQMPNPYAQVSSVHGPAERQPPPAAVSPILRADSGSTRPATPLVRRHPRSQQPGRLTIRGAGQSGGYDGDLLGKIQRYAQRSLKLVDDDDYDVIHAHDWMTFPGGIALAGRSGKPLVVHVHATEFDRSGQHVNQRVYDIERAGMHAASAVITVSQLTRQTVIDRYGVSPQQAHVVYNGIESGKTQALPKREEKLHHHRPEKVILFLGRITMQKNPGVFLDAAQQVLSRSPNTRAVVAGWGDLGPWMTEQVARRGLGHRIFFAGFLRGAEVDRAFRMADVYVMPSVTEPFGLTALEAIRNGTPVVLSHTSGVAEVLPSGSLKADHWDVDRMAEQIMAVLRFPALAQTLRTQGQAEMRQLTWDAAARRCIDVYEQASLQHGADWN